MPHNRPITVVYPKPPAHLEPYVRILGPQLAIEMFIKLGGSEVILSPTARRGMLRRVLGQEKASELGRHFNGLKTCIPLANDWLIEALHAEGRSGGEIARMIRRPAQHVQAHIRRANGGKWSR